jgi:hypothetical protein
MDTWAAPEVRDCNGKLFQCPFASRLRQERAGIDVKIAGELGDLAAVELAFAGEHFGMVDSAIPVPAAAVGRRKKASGPFSNAFRGMITPRQ